MSIKMLQRLLQLTKYYCHFQRAIKSQNFYKGASATDAESSKFLPRPLIAIIDKGIDEPDCDQTTKKSVWQQITTVLKKFGSVEAKRAFFVSFSLLLLSGMSWIFPGEHL